MQYLTDNTRITGLLEVSPPNEVISEFPITPAVSELVFKSRQNISDIIHGKDDKLVVVVGPCSIHDPKAAIEYAKKLKHLESSLSSELKIIMRVYFEKPRTTVGWKGLINDPNLDDSYDVNKGLRAARKILLEINEIGLPAATEYLDIITPQYISDLISWGAIGARTTESQVHRELASGLSCLQPDISEFGIAEFTRADEMAEIGKLKTRELISKLRELLCTIDPTLFK